MAVDDPDRALGNLEVIGNDSEKGGVRLTVNSPLAQEDGIARVAVLHRVVNDKGAFATSGFHPHGDVHRDLSFVVGRRHAFSVDTLRRVRASVRNLNTPETRRGVGARRAAASGRCERVTALIAHVPTSDYLKCR